MILSKMKLRKKFIIFALMVFVFTDLLISVIVYYSINSYKEKLIHSLTEEIIQKTKDNIFKFDQFLQVHEKEIDQNHKKALMGIGRQLEGKDQDLSKIDKYQLKKWAELFHVSEIYLIDQSGVVQATTFLADLKFNLFNINDNFKQFLKKLFGQGRIENQRLTISTKTGNVNKYSYYSPAGKKYIIEVSTSLKHFLIHNYSYYYYKFVFKDFFRMAISTNPYIKSIDMYAKVSETVCWSLLDEGIPFPDTDLMKKLKFHEEYFIKESARQRLLYQFVIDIKKEYYFNDYFIMDVQFDFSGIHLTMMSAIKSMIGISFFIFILVFLFSHRLFTRVVMHRLYQIIVSLRKIKDGNYEKSEEIQGKDEFLEIAQNITEMKQKIVEREQALMESIEKKNQAEKEIRGILKEKEKLLAELYHRTNNNMQVIISLIQLKASYFNDGLIVEVLKDIEMCIQGMSLVQQRLSKAKNLNKINIKDYIEELIQKQYFNQKKNIAFELDLKPIEILIDSAIPLGMVLNELITNSFKHAFPENRAGIITLKIDKNQEGEIILNYLDNGIGIPEGKDLRNRETMGSFFLFNVVEEQLNGKIAYQSKAGLSFQIEFKDNLYQERI